ncbi:MAG: DUF6709 family protein [Chloroflexota bacterium]
MSNDFVAAKIRGLNIRMLLVSLFAMGLVFAGLVLGARYLYNMLLGPFPISQVDLLARQDADDTLQYYVTVEGDDHADTGFTYVSKTDSGKETTEAYYHVLLVDENFLLIKSKTAEVDNTVTGALVNVPAETQTEVIDELEKEVPEIKGAFLPMMLDATDFHTAGYIGLGIGAIIALVAFLGAALAIYRLLTPKAHPVMKALANYGTLDTVVSEINMDMAQSAEKVGKKVHFTRRWLVSTTSSLQAMPYRDIIWCYKHVTQHRTNGIPTGKTYAMYVYDRHGKNTIIGGNEKQINQMLDLILKNVPGVVAGYSDELNNLWKKDRARFTAAVDQRRQGGKGV